MSQTKIIITGPLNPAAVAILELHGELIYAPNGDPATLMKLLADNGVALILRGGGAATKDLIDASCHLKVIARTGVGYDNVNVDAATARRVPVVYTPGAGARAVAEASMAMMLGLCKHLVHWDQQMKAGNWSSRLELENGDLDGSTLGIIGFGRIGQILASMAAPFDMNIIAHDPLVPPQKAAELNVELVDLNALMGRSDFICIHAALTNESRGLINAARLQKVKRGACLINLARGGLVESLDVVHEALQDGRLAGAGLDVFDPEPPDTSHPIFNEPNLLTAPHALGQSKRAMANIFKSMADDVVSILSGQRPKFVVNPQVL